MTAVRTWSPSPTLMAPVRIFPWLTAPRDRRHLAAQTADIQARTHNRLRVEGPHTATAEPSAGWVGRRRRVPHGKADWHRFPPAPLSTGRWVFPSPAGSERLSATA